MASFQIGDKVNTVRGKKVYQIVGVDQYGNFKMDSGAKFSGSYLRPVKTNEIVEFFRECEKIVWEPK